MSEGTKCLGLYSSAKGKLIFILPGCLKIWELIIPHEIASFFMLF